MKKNLLILFTIGMMATAEPILAQECVKFFGTTDETFSISTQRLEEEFSNIEVFYDELPPELQPIWDEFETRFPSKGKYELAVLVLRTERGLPVFVQQKKSGEIKRLVILSKGYGWIEASHSARKFLEKYFD